MRVLLAKSSSPDSAKLIDKVEAAIKQNARRMLDSSMPFTERLALAKSSTEATIAATSADLKLLDPGVDVHEFEAGLKAGLSALESRWNSLESSAAGKIIFAAGSGRTAQALVDTPEQTKEADPEVCAAVATYRDLIKQASLRAGTDGLKRCLEAAGCKVEDLKNIGFRSIFLMLQTTGSISDASDPASLTGESAVNQLVNASVVKADSYGLHKSRAMQDGGVDCKTLLAARVFCAWAQATWLLNTFVCIAWEGDFSRSERANFASFNGMTKAIADEVSDPALKGLRVTLEVAKDVAQLEKVLPAL